MVQAVGCRLSLCISGHDDECVVSLVYLKAMVLRPVAAIPRYAGAVPWHDQQCRVLTDTCGGHG